MSDRIYSDAPTYRINVNGVVRDLTVCKVTDEMSIAAFVIFGDVEMTVKAAEALLRVVPEHDIMITAEAKGIPLLHEMARQAGETTYIIARKGPKLYMKNPFSVEVHSITTAKKQALFLDETEAEKMRGKRVLIVDDVISTGNSLLAVEKLVRESGGTVVGKACILAEGDAIYRNDILYLEQIPLIFPPKKDQ
ncbi:MAG: adenine phosphoribosyltransferase [Clostridiales bacterium]|nr:adenine phosphoribosyltransferase [Clostridiales bacterium]